MNKVIIGLSLGIFIFATAHSGAGANAEAFWADATRKLAQAIGADLIIENDSTDAATTPKPEIQPAPATPESKPIEVTPKPIVSDTTA